MPTDTARTRADKWVGNQKLYGSGVSREEAELQIKTAYDHLINGYMAGAAGQLEEDIKLVEALHEKYQGAPVDYRLPGIWKVLVALKAQQET